MKILFGIHKDIALLLCFNLSGSNMPLTLRAFRAEHFYIFIIDHFYIAQFSALKQTLELMSHALLNEYLYPFIVSLFYFYFFIFLISTEVVYRQRCLVVAWLMPRETAAASAQGLCTPYNHAPVYVVTYSNISNVPVD